MSEPRPPRVAMPRADWVRGPGDRRPDPRHALAVPRRAPADLGRRPVRARARAVRRRPAPAAPPGVHPLRGARPAGGDGDGRPGRRARRAGHAGKRRRGAPRVPARLAPLRPQGRRARRARAGREPAVLDLQRGRPLLRCRGRAGDRHRPQRVGDGAGKPRERSSPPPCSSGWRVACASPCCSS